MSETAASMTFREHLIELRARVFKSVVAIGLGFFVAWNFHVELYAILTAPLRDAMAANNLFSIKALAITESIEVYMKLSLIGGIFLASPWVFWQIWAFVAPGLLSKEKRLILPVVASSVGCFALGALFCYLVALPFMADFLIKMTLEAPGLLLEPTIEGSVSFVSFLLLGFGAVFELPLFMYVLSALEMVTWRGFWGFYRYWVVIAFILGAVLTPTPDPVNQTIMSAPLVVLYGVGVALAWLTENRGKPGAAKRALVPAALILTVVAVAGTAFVVRKREVPPIAQVPADVDMVLGLHPAAADGLIGSADALTTARLLPLSMARKLNWHPTDGQWLLLRVGEGTAVVLQTDNAVAKVTGLAERLQVTLAHNTGTQSLVFADDAGRWTAVAVGTRTVWLGREAVIDKLRAVQAGRVPALASDPVMAERLQALAGSAPLWAVAPTATGVAAWLPGGALSEHVKLAMATWSDKELALRLDCKGQDAASALRDRLETWLADVRHEVSGSDPAVARRLARLAGLLAQAAQMQARASVSNAPEMREWNAMAREANQLAQDVGPAREPTETTDLLAEVLRPPTTSHLEVQAAVVTWRVELDRTKLGRLLTASPP